MEIEVLEKGTKGAFKVIVKQIFDNELQVEFENNWQPAKRVPFSECRLPPGPSTHECKEGDEVEVYAQVSRDEGHGWWPAEIKKVKGGSFVVDYTGGKTTYYVEKQRVRHRNKNPSVTSSTFHKCVIDIPDDLASVSKMEDSHEDFAQALGKATVFYDQAAKNIVVLTTDSSIVGKAIALSDMHLRHLKQREAVLKKAEGAKQQLQKVKVVKGLTTNFCAEFKVERSVMGLAIGSKGSTIKAAQAVPGVVAIRKNQTTCTITVVAKSEEALTEARDMLEFVKEVYVLPSRFAGRVIGQNGSNIKDIIRKSGVLQIETDRTDVCLCSGDLQENTVTFVLLGTKTRVQSALEMLNMPLDHLREVEKMDEEKDEVQKQLRSIVADQERSHPRFKGKGAGMKKCQSESDLSHLTMTTRSTRRRTRVEKRLRERDKDNISNAATPVHPMMAITKSKQNKDSQKEENVLVDNYSATSTHAQGRQHTKNEGPQVLIAPIPNPARCPEHPGELLRIYCMTCRKLICVSCWEKDHDDHETATAMKQIEVLRTDVATLMFDLQTTAEERKQQQTSLSHSVDTKRQSFTAELQSREKQQTATVAQLEKEYREMLDKAEQSFKKKKEDLVKAMTKTYKDKMESEIKMLQDASDKLKVECVDLDTTVSQYQTRLKTVAGAALLTPNTPTTQAQAEIESDCRNLTLDDVAALLPQLQRDVATPRTAPPVVTSEPTALHVPEHLKHTLLSFLHS